MKISIDEILNCNPLNDYNNNCGCNNMNDNNNCSNMGRKEFLKRISEASFALYDLNLFLDTHPDCDEALKLFKSLAFTVETLKSRYQTKYGPLEAKFSSEQTPFDWVAENQKWPWQKEGE